MCLELFRASRYSSSSFSIACVKVQVNLIEEKARINFETFLRILIKINIDSDNRPMSCKQFMMELESGEYGNFDFEEESLRHQIVMHGLTCLVNRKVFRRRILKKTEDEVWPLPMFVHCPHSRYLLLSVCCLFHMVCICFMLKSCLLYLNKTWYSCTQGNIGVSFVTAFGPHHEIIDVKAWSIHIQNDMHAHSKLPMTTVKII